MKNKTIIFSIAFLVSILMFFVNFLPAGELRSKTMMLPFLGIILFVITLIALGVSFISYLARKNNLLKRGIWIGAIAAIPFFFILVQLELGLYNNERGICPPHPRDQQLRLNDKQPICDRFYEAGLKDGEEWIGTGMTCVNGVYSELNYRCITYPLGFRESEAPLFPLWIILAEFYGILAGIIVGWTISKFRKKSV